VATLVITLERTEVLQRCVYTRFVSHSPLRLLTISNRCLQVDGFQNSTSSRFSPLLNDFRLVISPQQMHPASYPILARASSAFDVAQCWLQVSFDSPHSQRHRPSEPHILNPRPPIVKNHKRTTPTTSCTYICSSILTLPSASSCPPRMTTTNEHLTSNSHSAHQTGKIYHPKHPSPVDEEVHPTIRSLPFAVLVLSLGGNASGGRVLGVFSVQTLR
jgi:hypothetical protein